MTTTNIKLEGTDLSSRSAAAIQRHKLTSQISSGNKVIIDLSSILSVSHSYADELFGVFVEAYSLEKFLATIELYGASEHVLKSIASVISHRLKESDRPIPKTA